MRDDIGGDIGHYISPRREPAKFQKQVSAVGERHFHFIRENMACNLAYLISMARRY